MRKKLQYVYLGNICMVGKIQENTEQECHCSIKKRKHKNIKKNNAIC